MSIPESKVFFFAIAVTHFRNKNKKDDEKLSNEINLLFLKEGLFSADFA